MNPFLLRMNLALFCPLLMIACHESLLEIGPQGQLDEHTLATPAGVQATLTGAYALLDGWDGSLSQLNPPWAAAGSNWIWGSVTTDDAYKGAQPGEMPQIRALELYQWDADHPYLDIRFRALYEGIARTNATLRLLSVAAGIPDGDRDAIHGQARFLRAHYHFEAWKLWGTVPYYPETDQDFRKTNHADPLPLVIADLQAAISFLPESMPDVGRVNRWTARAYLGKVLLYDHRYSEARTALDLVVTTGPYELEDCFHTIFTSQGENGSEMILSIQASVNDGAPGGENGNFPDMLTFPGGASPFECCGFHQPSQNLVNAFRVDAQGLPLPDTYNDQNLGKNDFADPRLDWTVGRPGVPYLNWGLHDSTWIANPAASGPFSPKKFAHRQGEQSQVGWAGAQLGPVNIPILRYADVLLMLAECEVELGNLIRARELVNRVRSRAANCAQAPGGYGIGQAFGHPA